VPFYDRVDSAEAAVLAVRERLTERTVALYVSTPSNPTGRVLPRAWLEALADLARREELWLLSDEVYEDYVYHGEHYSIGAAAPERTLTVFSFSKAYGMAGNRTGYLVGPPEAVAAAQKISTHTFYAAPTAGQVAGLRALRDGAGWVERARACYRAVGEDAARALGCPPAEGSTFLFLDVRGCLDARGVFGFLEDCLADGVALTPGVSCGSDYATWVRLCYTAAPPDAVRGAVARLAARLRVAGNGTKLPIVTEIRRVNVQQDTREVEADCFSSDLQQINMRLKVLYRIPENSVVSVLRDYAGDPFERLILPRVQEATKEITALKTAADIVKTREQIKVAALGASRQKIGELLVIEDLVIEDVALSKELEQAIEAKMVQQQEAEKAVFRMQQAKTDAETQIIKARADAEAIRIQGEALEKTPKLVDLKMVEKWNGVAPQVVGSGSNILLPLK
jgi:hypothetical protein